MKSIMKESPRAWRTNSTYAAYNALCTHDDLYAIAKKQNDVKTLTMLVEDAYKRCPFNYIVYDVSWAQLREVLTSE